MFKENMGAAGTAVFLSKKEAKEVCRLGQGRECCAFLVSSEMGFGCALKYIPFSQQIYAKIERGLMIAEGRGGGKDCAWEERSDGR